MLDAVLLVLREVLEAALIVSLLLALSRQLGLRGAPWVLVALAGGFFTSWVLAHFAYTIADAVDGMGQELLNSLLFVLVIVCFILVIRIIAPLVFYSGIELPPAFPGLRQYGVLMICFIVIVVSAMARECSEIWIYLSSFTRAELRNAALSGGAIGVGIGVSVGVIVYFALVLTARHYFMRLFSLAVTLLIGGLSMQIAKELMQVGLLDSTAPLWDSSGIVSEHSWLGELLYALVGYDARPNRIQVIFYLMAVVPVVILLTIACYRAWRTTGSSLSVVTKSR